MSKKSKENEKIVTELYDAQSKGEFGTYFAFLSEDIVYHAAGDCPVSGVHKGKEKLKEIGMITFKETQGTHRVEMKSLLATDSHVAVVDTWRASRKDKEIEMDNLIVFKLEDSKITEIREFLGDIMEHDEFWK